MIEAVLALVTALVLLAAALAGLLVKINKGVEEVHIMVNSRMNEALARITQLHNALLDANVDVPGNGRDFRDGSP